VVSRNISFKEDVWGGGALTELKPKVEKLLADWLYSNGLFGAEVDVDVSRARAAAGNGTGLSKLCFAIRGTNASADWSDAGCSLRLSR